MRPIRAILKKRLSSQRSILTSRLKKVSLAIRNVLSMPDVLGIEEVENLKELKKSC